jgi:hypothetical protein
MKRRQFVGAGLSLAAAWPLTGWSAVLKGAGDLPAKNLDGGDLLLHGSSIEAFAASLRGDLLLRDHSAYDARRRVWNALFDRHPAMIACCTGAADVRRAVDFAREHRLLTAVRAGGHSFSGKSTCEGGLVIDLQSMQGVRVDPAARRAYLEAGSLLGQLDYECAAFGLATTAGTVSHTGAAGLTLGGGFGRLGRRFGLACDNVASFDVVTADGRMLQASDEQNPDLFWGLRGGGGNFGVATAIEYRVHEMNPMIYGGNLMWPVGRARDVMRHYRDITPTAPEVLHLEVGLVWTPDGPMTNVEACWSGDHGDGEKWLAPLRAFGKPTFDDIGPMPYLRIQGSLDEPLAGGKYYYAKNGFLTAIDDAGIDLVVDVFQREPGLFSLFIDPCDGAYHRVAADATAFSNRDARYWLGLVAGWPDDAGSEARIAKMRAAWRELEPLTQGFYANLSDPDTTLANYRGNYGTNFERLVALKAKYDPMNLFRLNANVPPKV